MLGQILWDGAHVTICRQHDWRVLGAHLLIRPHKVGDVTGEFVARHVINQQRNGAEALAQAERAVGGELTAADHLLEAEHRAASG